MCMAGFVEKAITGHISTPSVKARPGQRYARHARRRQTSVPTTTSASRHRPSSRNPVANSQWTCSAGGSTSLLQIFEQAWHDGEVEEQADAYDEQRRLHEQPPEALAVRVEKRQPIRLRDRPDRAGERGQRTKGRDETDTRGSLSWYFEFRDELCAHSSLLRSSSARRGATRKQAAAELRTRCRRGCAVQRDREASCVVTAVSRRPAPRGARSRTRRSRTLRAIARRRGRRPRRRPRARRTRAARTCAATVPATASDRVRCLRRPSARDRSRTLPRTSRPRDV